MDAPRPVVSPSIRAHKRQLAWQIIVPFLVVLALILAVAVLITTRTGSASRTWADISTIWLIVPMLALALLIFILLGFLIYGVAKLLQVTPRYTGKTRDFFSLLSGRTRSMADGTAKPIIWFRQAGAILKSIFRM
jgi:hypothetical protein